MPELPLLAPDARRYPNGCESRIDPLQEAVAAHAAPERPGRRGESEAADDLDELLASADPTG